MDESQATAAIRRRRWIGRAIIAIGVLHTLFGFVVMGPQLRAIARAGVINTVHGQPDLEAAFWFLFTGFALLLLGGTMDWIEARALPLPEFLRWALLAVTITGVVIMPASGFWLVLVPLAGMFFGRDVSK